MFIDMSTSAKGNKNRGVVSPGSTFGAGDTRATVDRSVYFERRTQLGATKELVGTNTHHYQLTHSLIRYTRKVILTHNTYNLLIRYIIC